MRKKNGFIATSILYSFFLVFVTLFIAMIYAFIQNQILLSKIEAEAKKNVMKINNLKLSDLVPGDHIKIASKPEVDSILNEDAIWTVAFVTTDGTKKTITLLDDTNANQKVYKIDNRMAPISINLYYALYINNYYTDFGFEYPGFQTNVIDSNTIMSIRNSSYSEDIKSALLNTTSNYLFLCNSSGCDNGQYYEYKKSSVTTAMNTNVEAVNSICNITVKNNGESFSYNSGNILGYTHLTEYGNNRQKKYIDYCYNPNLIPDTYYDSSIYIIRLMTTITVDVNDDTYIIGGSGTNVDPYIFKDGVKR